MTALARPAQAELSAMVKVGVLSDMSGSTADAAGQERMPLSQTVRIGRKAEQKEEPCSSRIAGT